MQPVPNFANSLRLEKLQIHCFCRQGRRLALSDVNQLHRSSCNSYLVSDEAHSRIRLGGLELLCDSVKIHSVNVDPQDEGTELTMKHLLSWVGTNLIKERPEMFMKGDTVKVRPGVLVLVNDCDWELTGQLDTVLEDKDDVVFISTLHGG
ncbi:Ubiquitin-related modifier 1 1 [Orobanche minor]